jgi:catechol 2,3-dioxygenase-like lactoylglutathione lyase family enzyme
MPTLCVPDLPATVDFYKEHLGFEVEFLWGDPPAHAGMCLDGVSIHFSRGKAGTDGFWLYFVVDDVDSLHAYYTTTEVEVLGEPVTQPWEMREFEVKDLNGYILRFGQSDSTAGEKLKIERVPVDARIERRLAAVMEDVAAHKGMSVSEMLEETLLHTFEALPNYSGAASPHTRKTMRHIEDLKKKHGIDYDTHASYRFTRTRAIDLRKISRSGQVRSAAALPCRGAKRPHLSFSPRFEPDMQFRIPAVTHQLYARLFPGRCNQYMLDEVC